MTYCLGLFLREGLVLLADTRTNAGLDNIATFRKMTLWERPGDRVIAAMTAGNLGLSQAVVNLLNEGLDDSQATETLYTVPNMFRAAQVVGRAIREVFDTDGRAMQNQEAGFNISILLGGQIKGRPMGLYHIYAAGNFIEASCDTPFLQIGEHKYGKPILDRAVNYDQTDLIGAVKIALISMDSTVRSNVSVGFPLDLMVYREGSLRVGALRRVQADDPYFRDLSLRWSVALRDAYHNIPCPPWGDDWDEAMTDARATPPGR